MARFRLLIEYEGTRYHGWQMNPGVKTIQGELLAACEVLFNSKKIELYGAGRTDAGVHALGQVAHLDALTQMKPEMIVQRLNDTLPYDIHILDALPCSAAFHARYSAIARSYVYTISRRRSAFGKRYVWWVKEDLTTGLMQEAGKILAGFHDFSSFGAASDEKESTKVNINHLNISEKENMILIHILGSHFLWMMVRRMVGVLVHAGKGKLKPSEIKEFLDHHSGRPSQLAAPPSGLYLQRVYYPGEEFDYEPEIPIMIGSDKGNW
jgi:tRNA pseudouridine38-40 synthase